MSRAWTNRFSSWARARTSSALIAYFAFCDSMNGPAKSLLPCRVSAGPVQWPKSEVGPEGGADQAGTAGLAGDPERRRARKGRQRRRCVIGLVQQVVHPD